LALTFATAKALWFGFLLLPKAKAAKSRTKGTLMNQASLHLNYTLKTALILYNK
jgi:hypothetical protein